MDVVILVFIMIFISISEPVELLLLTGLVYNGPPCDGNEIISCELAEVQDNLKYLKGIITKNVHKVEANVIKNNV